MRVPVVDVKDKPLMPTRPGKARKLMAAGKAVGKWNKLGVFYIQLTYEVEPNNQRLVVGIDPGSKWEGFTVQGEQETVLNVMVDAPTHIKKAVETRRVMRRNRRYRKCRRRPARFKNRLKGRKFLPPSTKARWEAKLRIVTQLAKILPLTDVVVEDTKAETRAGDRRWNVGFSPIQQGKNYLYAQLREMGLQLHIFEGQEVAGQREILGLEKSEAKPQPIFSSQCVDSFTLSTFVVQARQPTSQSLYYLKPIRLHRRQLHRLQPEKGGRRKPYGGTRSQGLKRGTLVIHPIWGKCFIGGQDQKRGRVSLHSYATGKRLTQSAKTEDCQVLTSTVWRNLLIGGAMETKSTKGARYNLNYHLVWCPKYRRKILTGFIAVRLIELLKEITQKWDFEIIAQEVMPDHVHYQTAYQQSRHTLVAWILRGHGRQRQCCYHSTVH